jgi:cobalt/nickel transport protein
LSTTYKNLILLLFALALILTPFIVQQGADFAGADEKAQEIIGEVRPDYEPWFSSLWEPPSGEVESLLFAVQAALGGVFLGYYFGYQKGKVAG